MKGIEFDCMYGFMLVRGLFLVQIEIAGPAGGMTIVRERCRRFRRGF